jgi:hypothetical protein
LGINASNASFSTRQAVRPRGLFFAFSFHSFFFGPAEPSGPAFV